MKSNRQEVIQRIIEDEIISTQDELLSALNKRGYNVTQSTVSRDIKQLKLFKGHDSNGNYRYLNNNSKNDSTQSLQHYIDIIKRSVTDVQYALNTVVVKCFSGMAQSICVALDSIYAAGMLGSIAGEDTVIIITSSEEAAAVLTQEIRKLI